MYYIYVFLLFTYLFLLSTLVDRQGIIHPMKTLLCFPRNGGCFFPVKFLNTFKFTVSVPWSCVLALVVSRLFLSIRLYGLGQTLCLIDGFLFIEKMFILSPSFMLCSIFLNVFCYCFGVSLVSFFFFLTRGLYFSQLSASFLFCF